jgi:hypothetical protein
MPIPKLSIHPVVEREFREYARTLGGATARAAEEGYDVRTAVLEDVLAQLLQPPDPKLAYDRSFATMHETGTKYAERSNPDEHAFAVLDGVRSQVAAVEKPACIDLQVSRIMRATKPSSSSALPDQKYTAVLVYVRSPITDERIVVYRVEPA